MRIEIHRRSQHAKAGCGPDTYVAITIAPDGVKVPYALNQSVLRKRGIRYIYIGEGYARHDGPRSMLGQAFSRAYEVAQEEASKITESVTIL